MQGLKNCQYHCLNQRNRRCVSKINGCTPPSINLQNKKGRFKFLTRINTSKIAQRAIAERPIVVGEVTKDRAHGLWGLDQKKPDRKIYRRIPKSRSGNFNAASKWAALRDTPVPSTDGSLLPTLSFFEALTQHEPPRRPDTAHCTKRHKIFSKAVIVMSIPRWARKKQ